jgi:hypothetical protein
MEETEGQDRMLPGRADHIAGQKNRKAANLTTRILHGSWFAALVHIGQISRRLSALVE